MQHSKLPESKNSIILNHRKSKVGPSSYHGRLRTSYRSDSLLLRHFDPEMKSIKTVTAAASRNVGECFVTEQPFIDLLCSTRVQVENSVTWAPLRLYMPHNEPHWEQKLLKIQSQHELDFISPLLHTQCRIMKKEILQNPNIGTSIKLELKKLHITGSNNL